MQRMGSLILAAFILLGAVTCACAEDDFIYNAKGKRDPFIALVTPEGRLLRLDDEAAEAVTISLQGILYDPQGVSYAVVNGESVQVGDYVGDSQVLRIEKSKVVFIKAGELSQVTVNKEE